ncbi:YrhK-like protein [Paracoccus isoporae]|uniref:YrhK-like protein n=1 Tax=Paracoccus isoporae TaxID=591205 RepID=A0A1G7GDD0_9RHOB|nr:YrhK family protein [Paracoccus isoporae]SDE86085.1 YrhK-like protein [Paracoccus isoporae]
MTFWNQAFRPDLNARSEEAKQFYAKVEFAYTLANFIAAIMFLIGSAMAFWPSTGTVSTWMFIFGSIVFAIKPTLNAWREWKLFQMGDASKLADDLESS